MRISWDRSDARIWFGQWRGSPGSERLHLVVEQQPITGHWDWSVWDPDQTTIVRHGTEATAMAAAIAAEAAAVSWPFRSP